jgi:hypothetical protein
MMIGKNLKSNLGLAMPRSQGRRLTAEGRGFEFRNEINVPHWKKEINVAESGAPKNTFKDKIERSENFIQGRYYGC